MKEKKKWTKEVFGNKYVKGVIEETFKIKKNNLADFGILMRSWRILLFYGPPGVGKSMMIKKVANQTERTVFWVSISNLISRFMGESEKMVEILFELAKEYQPSLIIMEEVDSIGRKRTQKESNTERRLKIEFLQQMDSLQNCDEDIIFLGTTNLPWDLDIAFLRRFERKILFPLLNKKERIKMIKFSFSKIFNFTDEFYDQLGDHLQQRTGAEINNYIRDIMIKFSQKKEIDFKKVIKNHQPSISKKSMNNYVKFLKKFGENEQLNLIEKNLYQKEDFDYII